MSRDQRPGRVRVISPGEPAETLDRRRGDEASETDLEVAVAPPAPTTSAERATPSGLSPLLVTALFMAGCAIGGAMIAALGLFEMPF